MQGGDRLPWVTTNGTDNYGPLAAMAWQVHVYGTARPDLADWCKAKTLPLHVFAWRPDYEKAGLAPDALYLLRPDSYVALADAAGSVDTLERYLTARNLRP